MYTKQGRPEGFSELQARHPRLTFIAMRECRSDCEELTSIIEVAKFEKVDKERYEVTVARAQHSITTKSFSNAT